MTSITFNGKVYNSLEEMPSNERQAYEHMMKIFVDANGNGIPDFLEGDIVKNVMVAAKNISADGKIYEGMNELPNELRAKIQTAFEKMNELEVVTKNTSPMMMEVNSVQVTPKEPDAQSQPFVSREFSPAIEEEKSSSALPWVLGVAALLFCLALAAFALFYFIQ